MTTPATAKPADGRAVEGAARSALSMTRRFAESCELTSVTRKMTLADLARITPSVDLMVIRASSAVRTAGRMIFESCDHSEQGSDLRKAALNSAACLTVAGRGTTLMNSQMQTAAGKARTAGSPDAQRSPSAPAAYGFGRNAASAVDRLNSTYRAHVPRNDWRYLSSLYRALLGEMNSCTAGLAELVDRITDRAFDGRPPCGPGPLIEAGRAIRLGQQHLHVIEVTFQ